jgi:ornithine carbamoyltransferase
VNPRHLLDIDDLTAEDLGRILALAADPERPQVLTGQSVALLFEKPSARTRHSSEAAVNQLGGHPVSVRGDEVGIDVRETAEDVARTLACYHSVIGARVFDHGRLERMAKVSQVPVVNLLSDRSHPCQALADVLTLQQEWGTLAGRSVAWVGDFSNVARSLALAVGLAGATMRAACPEGFGPSDGDREAVGRLGREREVTTDPVAAVDGVDAVVTDVWTSMGQEDEREARLAAFAGYTVTSELLAKAQPDAVFLHCLPAHRGEEVAGEVIDGPRSRVWPEAENRMHAMRGLLRWLVAS